MDNNILVLLRNLECIKKLINQNCIIKTVKYFEKDVLNAQMSNFDDSKFTTLTSSLRYNKILDTLWIRFHVEIPDAICGISTLGSSIRIMSIFQVPIKIFVDGQLVLEEKNWTDCRFPEIILTNNAKAGDYFIVAMKINPIDAALWNNAFFIEGYIDKIDDIRFDIDTFISEINYLSTLENSIEFLNERMDSLLQKTKNVIDIENNVEELIAEINRFRNAAIIFRSRAKLNTLHLVGHAHIDMNWLWSMEETEDLIKRDFTTVCDIMDDNPSFKFSQSQCATYDITKKKYPELFKRVESKIQNGQWDVTASAWVENDNNLVSGESIARHILYSKKYLKQNFNIEPQIMWCPDTFGHSANIPQILVKGGISRYFFMRCGFEDTKNAQDNHFYGRTVSDMPVFKWKGIDGSEVVVANLEYNGEFNTNNVIRNVGKNNYREIKNSLLVFGVGDHGGGPTKRDIKRAIKAMESNILPKIQFSSTEDYFNQLEIEDINKLPVREGEMNFVFEGCYTSHSDIKKSNRIMESTLYRSETINLLSYFYGHKYPDQELEECWKTLLFNQFHDIFDGCAKAQTYELAKNQIDNSLNTLNKQISIAANHVLNDENDSIIVFNNLPFVRDVIIKFENKFYKKLYDENNHEIQVQNDGTDLFVLIENIPGFSFKEIRADVFLNPNDHNLENESLHLTKQNDVDVKLLLNYEDCNLTKQLKLIPNKELKRIIETEHYYIIENEFYYVEVKKVSGELTTLFDKISSRFVARRGIECWRSTRGCLNTFAIYEEATEPMSAWTIGQTRKIEYITNSAESTIISDGELISIIKFNHKFKNSAIEQKIIFEKNSPTIKFETKVDWKEIGNSISGTPTLRITFTPEIENSNIFNEIPFGVIKRSCKSAELPTHKWSAIADEKSGFAILNDCKYGVKIIGNELDLTLIRSSWDPDIFADITTHEFTYAIYCFDGQLETSNIHQESIKINIPCEIFYNKSMPKIKISLPEIENSKNIVLSSIKLSEDGKGFIMRLYESFGIPSEIIIKIDKIKSAIETDINEIEVYGEIPIENTIPINSDNKSITLKFTPFEIKTIKIIKGEGNI